LLSLTAAARADEPPAEVQEFLDAGEFGPARNAAVSLEDAAARDAALAAVAAAQAGAGGRRAALDTTYSIESDLARKSALDRIGAAPPPFFGSSAYGGAGGRGGGVVADFDSLIELITTTVSPQSWDEVGGPGAISEFATGVYVDSLGLLKKLPPQTDRSLIAVRAAAATIGSSADPRKPAILRKVSLNRLEREVQMLHALGREPTEAMQTLAGLARIQYVLVYPDSGDIVLAGPAGDWRRNSEGRFVTVDKGAPVLSLDDLVVTLRNAYSKEGRFGCSIVPRKENLAAAQAVNDRWSKAPLKPGQRERWLKEFQAAMGRQDIVTHGIDPRTHACLTIVEADYRMKLVGIGLEESVAGVESYLDSIEVSKDGKIPPMSVLRWWFTLNYDALTATESRDAFALNGPGVKVLSENEMLTEKGERVHTGKSDELNSRFAESFTKHYELLAAKYPLYAELRNVFDLALVGAVIQSHDLPGQCGWHMTHFGPDGAYQPALGIAPTEVESVLNHKVLAGGKNVIAAVSGGVVVDARQLAGKQAVKTDTYGALKAERVGSAPQDLPRNAWWWD
jgi:hypothetical protein